MTNTVPNKSFRIKNSCQEFATVWPISEYYFTVVFDGDHKEDCYTYSKEDIESFFEQRSWTKIEEAPSEESLPPSFNYYHIDEPDVVGTFYPTGENSGVVFYNNGSEPLEYWGPKEAEKFIQAGTWVVLPSDATFTIYGENSKAFRDAKQALEDRMTNSSDFLSIVKEFTVDSGHCVFIDSGVYKLYRANEDLPYVCKDEEELLAAMNALSLLDKFGEKV